MTEKKIRQIAREETKAEITSLLESCVELIRIAKKAREQPINVNLPKNWGKVNNEKF
jgi:hypothetical protein